jgi:hypothetical protein
MQSEGLHKARWSRGLHSTLKETSAPATKTPGHRTRIPAAAKAYHLTFSARIQHKTVERGSHTARRRATACGIRLEDHGHISHLGTHSNPNPKPEIWDHTSTKIATAAQQPARHSSEAGIAHVEHSKTSTRNSVAGFLFSRQEARYVRLPGFSSL